MAIMRVLHISERKKVVQSRRGDWVQLPHMENLYWVQTRGIGFWMISVSALEHSMKLPLIIIGTNSIWIRQVTFQMLCSGSELLRTALHLSSFDWKYQDSRLRFIRCAQGAPIILDSLSNWSVMHPLMTVFFVIFGEHEREILSEFQQYPLV